MKNNPCSLRALNYAVGEADKMRIMWRGALTILPSQAGHRATIRCKNAEQCALNVLTDYLMDRLGVYEK